MPYRPRLQAVTLGEQRGFTLEQFARIVSCYLQDSDNVFRCGVCLCACLCARWWSLLLGCNRQIADGVECEGHTRVGEASAALAIPSIN